MEFMPMNSSTLTRLHYQHKTLVDLIDGLSEEMIRRNVVSGKWSIFENIVHLQTYQHTFCARMKQLMLGENPTFSRYTAESDPYYVDNCHKSMREVMHDLLTIRKEMVNNISSLQESDLKKTAVHPTFGKMDLPEWLNFFLLHEAHHLFTIFRLSAELKKETSLTN